MQIDPLSPPTFSAIELLLARARELDLPLRVAGSMGILLHCPEQLVDFSRRREPIGNIDLAAFGRNRRAINDLLLEHGFRLDRHYSTGDFRRTYLSAKHAFRCDVCFDCLPFCHTVPLGSRLLVDNPTLPPAELLVQKLQIVGIDWKHICDIQVLLAEHETADHDREAVNAPVIAGLCARNWGLYSTVLESLETAAQFTRGARDLPAELRDRIIVRLELVRKFVQEAPKPLNWRLRRLAGRRLRWHQTVEHRQKRRISE